MSFFTKDGKFKFKNIPGKTCENDRFFCNQLLSYGISDGIRLATYDAIQSLFAVATVDSKIYVFKDKNVKVRYSLAKKSLIQHLILHCNYLIAIDSKNNLYSWSIDTTSLTPSTIYTLRGHVICIETDPCIDWLYIGFRNGTIDVWDIDRECISPYKINNLYIERHEEWRQMDYDYAPPRSYVSPVISIKIHPRDLGMILIGYPDGVVLYSIKKKSPIYFFELEVPQRIYEKNSTGKVQICRPKLTSFSWAPHGYHFVTSYQNGCFAFWSAKSNQRPLLVRTLDETEIDILVEKKVENDSYKLACIRNPIFSIIWSCNDNLEDTSIFIVGGNLNNQDSEELNILDFGQCPSISLSSANVFSRYYASPRQCLSLSHFLSDSVVDICVFQKTSQKYLGNYNIESILLVLASGEVELLKYPDGFFLNSLKSLPASLEWMSPRIHDVSSCFISNISPGYEKDDKGLNRTCKSQVSGQQKSLSYNEIIATGHNNGIVRLYNVTSDYRFEKIHEIFVGKTLNIPVHMTKITIVKISEASTLAIGCERGELIIYDYFSCDKTKVFESDNSYQTSKDVTKYNVDGKSKSNSSTDNKHIASSNDGKNEDNFSCFSIFQIYRGSVISLKMSNIGLISCGYEFGTVILINIYKHTIVLQIELSEVKNTKLRDFENDDNSELEVAVVFEFTVGKIKTKDKPSVLFIIGTSFGRLIFYSIDLIARNEFKVKYLGEFLFEDDLIVNILPIYKNTLKPYTINSNVFKNLADISVLENSIIIVTRNSLRIYDSCFIEMSQYLYKKSVKCVSANIVYLEEIDAAVACVLDDKKVLLFTLLNLNIIATIDLPPLFDEKLNKSIVTMTGNIYLWTSPAELSLFYLLGTGTKINAFSFGVLYDNSKKIPPRPAISTWEWMLSTNYISVAELDLLLGGPDRPLSKKLIDSLEKQELKNKEKKKATLVDQHSNYQNSNNIFSQTTDNIRERGKKIFGVEEKLQSLEKSSVNLLKSIQDYAEQQKSTIRKQAIKGVIKNFFK
ncbi:hypothetical protein PORY_000861 [Pneumocystis oryctolagi]|uniref:Uncharacterized protein n=1 Tax=Pneumocystis oryctolagi TaxID=42067 RepID=A0ACB7CEE7_9ASCO|nr:hypothetical protein PORY_000861 [Pneumocystis oryctolagi]